MFRRSSALVLLVAFLAPALAHAAWSHDPSVNTPVRVAANGAFSTVAVSDGVDGAFVGWIDTRGAAADVYVQHLTANGDVAAGWPANGLAVCTAPGPQGNVQISTDPGGSLYVAWDDQRSGFAVYLQRVLANGSIAPGWPANGVLVSSTTTPFASRVCTDGAGGVFVSWVDAYSGTDYDVYLTRITPAGALVGGFPVTVDFSFSIQDAAQLTPEAAGGVCVAYESKATGNYDIWVKHYTSSGVLGAAQTLAAGGEQTNPVCVADGFGGALVAYADGPSSAILIGRFAPAYTAPLWGPNTVMVDGTNQYVPKSIAADGAGGAYIVGNRSFIASRLLVTHVLATGLPAAGWSSQGNLLSESGFPTTAPAVSDGRGGLLTLWYDLGSRPILVNRLLASGNHALGWPTPTAGVMPGVAPYQNSGALVADGDGGAIAFWTDIRNVGQTNLFAQRIERFGRLGNPEPAIVNVRDVPVDQGGKVRVAWTPSYLDADPDYGVASYRIWRQVPARLVAQALAAGAVLADDGGAAVALAGAAKSGARVLRATANATATIYWEPIATQLANGQAGYSFVASTEGDSVGAGNPRTLFMVEAVGTDGAFWDSAPDSGYSVDNLPPSTPAPFTGAYAPTFTHLSWGRSSDADFVGYRLYRGATAGFVPSGATLFASASDTGYVAPGGNWYWKLTAVDVHGNESAPALVSPSGTVGVGDAPPVLAFERTSANPTQGASAFRLALPRAARASVRVYDAAGRLVREVAAGEFAAGTHDLRWDGRDAAGGESGPGLYFVRVSTPGLERSVRVVRL